MDINNIQDLIGQQVVYMDYLDMEHSGHIVYLEPTTEPDVLWAYVEDEDPELNDKSLILPNNTEVRYAEVRKSTEIYLDVDRNDTTIVE